MQSYRAAAIQMNSQPDYDHNLEQAYELLKKAAEQGVRFAALPENFTFLGDFNARMEQAEEMAERTPGFLKEVAKEFSLYILGGSYPVPAGNGKVYNRCMLVNPEGRFLAKYEKIHLFDVDLPEGETYRESDYVESGRNIPVVGRSDELGNIGMSICYDLRFPELYRSLVSRMAEVLCVPSAFTDTTGQVHWKPLLRARAIENTAYVIAPAQTGTHGEKRQTHGHSLIIDPWGQVLADAGREVGMAIAEIDGARLSEVRQRIPSLEHRRMHLLGT